MPTFRVSLWRVGYGNEAVYEVLGVEGPLFTFIQLTLNRPLNVEKKHLHVYLTLSCSIECEIYSKYVSLILKEKKKTGYKPLKDYSILQYKIEKL